MRIRPPVDPWSTKPQFQQDNYYPARAGFPRPESALAKSMDLLLKEMDQVDVRWGLISARHAKAPLGVVPNEAVAKVIQQHPQRFMGFASIDLDRPETWNSELDHFLAKPGFKGVSIEPSAAVSPMFIDDPKLYPIYEYCQRKKVPISITLSLELVKLASNSWEYASPMRLFQAARDFPQLQFIAAHAAWPFVQEILGIAFVLPNVWLSPDLYMVGLDVPFASEYVKAANLYLGERMVFGTGYPSRPHKESIEAFLRWPFAPGVAERLMKTNARQLLGIDDF